MCIQALRKTYTKTLSNTNHFDIFLLTIQSDPTHIYNLKSKIYKTNLFVEYHSVKTTVAAEISSYMNEKYHFEELTFFLFWFDSSFLGYRPRNVGEVIKNTSKCELVKPKKLQFSFIFTFDRRNISFYFFRIETTKNLIVRIDEKPS